SHQFYPTPENLAKQVVELAAIESDHDCLEPSAGTGGLAKFMPKERTTCVEISSMHEAVLSAQGFQTIRADFIDWAQQPAHKTFERVIMNQAFSEGRWRSHVEAAAGMVRPGGRLVAILPSGAKSCGVLSSWEPSWHGPFENEFAGTSVAVVVLVADRPKV
ncbi:MAG: restriction endonuclease subunit M, partial [Burkholderiales bacterium PBB4]